MCTQCALTLQLTAVIFLLFGTKLNEKTTTTKTKVNSADKSISSMQFSVGQHNGSHDAMFVSIQLWQQNITNRSINKFTQAYWYMQMQIFECISTHFCICEHLVSLHML